MFLYPALTLGFLFVGVPLLVHLINMLRHRRQRWAAMDFLLASYRKQKKWIHLRQLLLLLARIAVAALLIAVLCGWSGGRDLLDTFGGTITHHVIVLDDSYSMGDRSTSEESNISPTVRTNGGATTAGNLPQQIGGNAYARALSTIQDLTRYLANSDGEHQLTVMRASRAAMSVRAGSDTGDAAADLSSQTVGEDARLINRIMSTLPSAVSVDLIPAIDLATELLRSTPADEKYFYVLSDFREREWGAADRLSESLGAVGNEVPVRLIDCASDSDGNLGITSVTPSPDVWVAGVPVMMRVSVKNYGTKQVSRVPINVKLIRYPNEAIQPDASGLYSGAVESLPDLVIDEINPGQEVTKTFQVYVAEVGTHAVHVNLPSDSLSIDNERVCTLPLTSAERVLIVDGDVDARGAYHIASSLSPGGQVEVGVLPDLQPPSFLRSINYETLSGYRAVYLINLPEISQNAADALSEYVRRGGGLAWFLGDQVNAAAYNRYLISENRSLLPRPLNEAKELEASANNAEGDMRFGKNPELFGPLVSVGDGILSLVSVTDSWGMDSTTASGSDASATPVDYEICLQRRDGAPLVTQHRFGEGRILTSLVGLDGSWSNWPGDPTFVVFSLRSNAWLWSGASPPVSRGVESPYTKQLAATEVLQQASFLPPSLAPPRVPFDITGAEVSDAEKDQAEQYLFEMSPSEMLIRGDEHLEEILRPGWAEWQFLATDGTSRIIPQASVIQVGDGDLLRADHGSILQQLAPLNVRFVQRRTWNQDEMVSGSSAMTLFLLVLLLLFLALEQGLAYWASYHASGKQVTSSLSGLTRARGPRERTTPRNDTFSSVNDPGSGSRDTARQTQGGAA